MSIQYLATFHTHLAALRTERNLRAKGIPTKMSPVPRKLSSSCGTCVRYEASEAYLTEMDTDVEGVYSLIAPEEYELLYKNNLK